MSYKSGNEFSDSASLGSNPSSPATKNPAKQGFFDRGQSGQGGLEGEPAPHKSRHSGYVYFIWDAKHEVIKIGHAVNLGSRLAGLQTGNPNKLGILEAFRGSRALEKALHKRFRPLRIAGEWFRADEAIWDFLEDVEDLQLGALSELTAQGQQAAFVAEKCPWHDIDIPEERILALAPPQNASRRRSSDRKLDREMDDALRRL